MMNMTKKVLHFHGTDYLSHKELTIQKNTDDKIADYSKKYPNDAQAVQPIAPYLKERIKIHGNSISRTKTNTIINELYERNIFIAAQLNEETQKRQSESQIKTKSIYRIAKKLIADPVTPEPTKEVFDDNKKSIVKKSEQEKKWDARQERIIKRYSKKYGI